MPQVTSGLFPLSTRSQVWDKFLNALQTDPVLSSRVRLWQICDGSESSNKQPDADDLPYLAVDPQGGPQRWNDENSHVFVWNLKIEIALEGTAVKPLFDFWAAIEAALFTGNTVLNDLYKVGVINKTITGPATETREFGGAVGRVGVGTISVTMRIDS